MAKFRCRLCGGKLIDNRCTFCGLDNSCYDRDLSLQKTVSEQQAHPSQPAAVQQPPPVPEKKVQQPPPAKHTGSRSSYRKPTASNEKKRNTAARVTIIIIAIAIFGSIISAAGSTLMDAVSSMMSGSTYDDLYSPDDYDWSFDDWDPYAFVTRDIPDDGEVYETVLGTGTYQTGIHIPEGIYHAELLEGAGSINISDSENSIYKSVYFNADEEYGQVTGEDDIRLYNGSELHVDSGVLIHLSTDNAQPLTETPYPDTSSDVFPLPEGEYTTDSAEIPEGIYDISIAEDAEDPYGYASVTLLYPNGSSGYFWVDSPESGVSADGYSSAGAKNVVIPDGTEISVEYGDIILTPGQACYDVDYTNYPQQ